MTELEQLHAEVEAIKVILAAISAHLPAADALASADGALRLFEANSLAATNLTDDQRDWILQKLLIFRERVERMR